MHVLVTGGAGYVGSAIVHCLLAENHDVRVLDDLSTGHREAVPSNTELIEGSLLDQVALKRSLTHIDAVIHCAGKSLVSESVTNPEKYFLNNVEGSRMLIEAMREQDVSHIVFSSSAATYRGDAQALTETSAEEPSNPYGQTKLEVDKMLLKSGFTGTSFRYFNVAGALLSHGRWYGERHSPETHLIPNVLGATPDEPLKIFGNTWATPDGTCIRDYIHVADLARAHVMALSHRGFDICNLGSGNGSSVMTVVTTASEVLNRPVPHQVQEPRAGDPAVLVASYAKAERIFGWKPEKTLSEMITDAVSFKHQPW